jgi:hypothetical protein
MGRGPSGGRPVLDLFVEQWPMLIFVPAVLILVAVLAGVTRWWDRRDAQRSTDTTARGADAATGHVVAARSLRTTGNRSRSRWWRRTHCTCSWHTVRTEIGEPPPEGTTRDAPASVAPIESSRS